MFTSAAYCRARPRHGTDLTELLYEHEALRIGFVNKIVEPDNVVNGHASIRAARSVNNTDLAVALPC
jgi:enoyl-CoA hydratase/carnithine racemase